MRIAVDIDSTLHHYWDVLSACAERRFGIDLPYEEQLDWGVTRLRPEQFKLCVEESHSDATILAGKPYPGAVETLNRWHSDGHFIHVTSHRSVACQRATARWLDRIGLEYDELYCSFDKVARCREVKIDVLIDDSPDVLLGALEAGIIVATLTHPWNTDVCEEENVITASDWQALGSRLDVVLRTETTA
jgi:uncharacterized HAD superfamily protein